MTTVEGRAEMKKRILLIVMVLMLGLALVACGDTSQMQETQKHTIVCTSFAAYDWTNALMQNVDTDFEVEYLLDNGVDLHNFQPTTEDFVTINNCDAFLYFGGVSDTWVKDALQQNPNKNRKTIDFMNLHGIKFVENIEPDHDCEEEGHYHEHNHEVDEHIWLSIHNAETCVQEIAKMLMQLEPKNAEFYQENCNNYIKQLEALDREFKDTVKAAKGNMLLFADRFPFVYLTEAYGLEYEAAFPGCSAETEASFDTLVSLINILEEYQLPAVYVMEHSESDVAETIIRESSLDQVDILTMHSMQSVSKQDIQQGATYLSLMEDNRNVLEQGLK